ncbi:MAG: hypothetical protein QOJ07_806 [Thermoleophilaceae bacterium]|nr:hypothetical protein [Thermoleophilaceae bacterium]
MGLPAGGQHGRMRITRSALALASIALLAAAPAAPARAPRDRCAVKRTRTVLQNSYVRLYEGHAYVDDMGNDRVATYACSRKTGRSRRLDLQSSIEQPRLAGKWIAYVEDSQRGIDDERLTVTVDQVRGDYQTVRRAYGYDTQVPAVRSLVLASNGAAGWIATDDEEGTVYWDVGTVGATDVYGTVLDSGPDIVPESLRLSAGTLSWTRAGATRTAPAGHP